VKDDSQKEGTNVGERHAEREGGRDFSGMEEKGFRAKEKDRGASIDMFT